MVQSYVFLDSQLLEFDQSEFLGFQANMDHTGYVYVPTACQNEATGDTT